MNLTFNVAKEISDNIKRATTCIKYFEDNLFDPDIQLADPRFGDFQANGLLNFSKRIKQNPNKLAVELINYFEKYNVFPKHYIEYNISGSGFINFKLLPSFLLDWFKKYHSLDSFQESSYKFYKGKIMTIDYSSPNAAKQMHVGHLRSMNIGESLKRLLKFYGANVISDNHIGDWGTQYGILIMAIHKFNFNFNIKNRNLLEDLELIYKKGTILFNTDSDAKNEAHQALVKLQKEDKEYLKIWEKINKISYESFEEIYNIFNIKFDFIMGESFYRKDVNRIYKELLESKIAEINEGALVVFHKTKNQKDFSFIVRKSDGASNYATTDLATILHHVNEFKAEKMIYVTDSRQKDHFKYLFLTAKEWFKKLNYKNLPEFHHIEFGTILGENNKAIKTREGDSIKLKDLIKEAINRAFIIVSNKNPNFSENKKNKIAKIIGIGSLRYSDLLQNRKNDYKFNWDKLLSFDGNTAPYILYAIARIYSIFNKLKINPESFNNFRNLDFEFETKEEIALAKKIVFFPIEFEKSVLDFAPHYICNYLFELTSCFSTFYKKNKVLLKNEAIQSKRLILCSRTLLVLETGFHLLGIETLKEM